MDNITTPIADNIDIATDEIGNVHYSLVKVSHGPDGEAVHTTIGDPFPVALPDPIFDHANGTKTTVTSGTDSIVINTGTAKFINVFATEDILIRTDGSVASDTGGSMVIIAGQNEVLPVPPATAISALAMNTDASVYVTPLKSR